MRSCTGPETADSVAQTMPLRTLLLTLAFVGSVAGQVSPTTPKAAHVRIIEGPEPERADSYLTIIRWITNNPGGSPVHYGFVHYGTDPKNLSETAKNPIRLNPYHSSTTFRVRIDNLKPRTTYYYTVESEEANGGSDGVKSPVHRFTTQ